MGTKRDWITRMVDIFHGLEFGIIYNQTTIREFLQIDCDDSISLPTTGDLIQAILKAQENGMNFVVNGKNRKLIERKTARGESRYLLMED
ncbi:MAG: hypothetical protein GF317_06855 [Candidatus Lokiarchaeota archaeon]|nr:hypothetical protein [Candidatus Lokiarchaeota archaeon]MBD3199429.1 hypothetical protein [Candidatus Lokiarchaeota archaeon]